MTAGAGASGRHAGVYLKVLMAHTKVIPGVVDTGGGVGATTMSTQESLV